MITADEVAAVPLFAQTSPETQASIAAASAEVHLREDDWLVHEGESGAFFVVLSGSIEVLKRYGNSRRQMAVRGPGEYLGDLPLVLNAPFFAGARALEPSRLLRVEPIEFYRLLRESAAIRDEILAKVVHRVEGLEEEVTTCERPPLVVGDRFDPKSHEIRDFLARNRQVFEWYDRADGRRLPAGVDLTGATFPAVVLSDGKRLDDPSKVELAEALGLRTEPLTAEYDVAIIGGGPAGLAAAVYGASEGLRTLLLERYATGGQAGTSSRIENYLGFPAGLSGDDLATRAHTQAERFGTEIVVGREVESIEPGAPFHTIRLGGGARVKAHAIVVASGVKYRTMPVEGIEAFAGAGVFYGASRSEAPSMRGKDVLLIGGGNSAGQAAMFFSTYARCVTIAIRGERLDTSMSAYLIDEIGTKENIRVWTERELTRVEGRDHLEAVVVRDKRSGEELREPVDAVFIFIGADAFTDWLPATVVRDERGYVCTGRDVLDLIGAERPWPHERDPFLLETSVPGIFAAGDVRHGSIKRVAAGVGEGSMAIAFVHSYLASLKENP